VFSRVAISAVTSGAVGVAASPVTKYAWVVDLMPMVIAVIMVIIVRAIIDMNAAKKRAWNYNLLVMTLCSIFTAVFVHEYSLSAGAATLFGMGTGAMGVGIISFGKPMLLAVITKAQESLKTPPSLP